MAQVYISNCSNYKRVKVLYQSDRAASEQLLCNGQAGSVAGTSSSSPQATSTQGCPLDMLWIQILTNTPGCSDDAFRILSKDSPPRTWLLHFFGKDQKMHQIFSPNNHMPVTKVR